MTGEYYSYEENDLVVAFFFFSNWQTNGVVVSALLLPMALSSVPFPVSYVVKRDRTGWVGGHRQTCSEGLVPTLLYCLVLCASATGVLGSNCSLLLFSTTSCLLHTVFLPFSPPS